MNSNQTESLKSALQKYNDLNTQLAALRSREVSNGELLVVAEREWDLIDAKALEGITRCQTIARLLPGRIINCEEAITQSEQELLKACHSFISDHLGPRIREAISRAKASVRAALKAHFSNADELDRAVGKSDLVEQLESFAYYATIGNNPPGGIKKYSERLLQTWTDCDALEAKLK